MPLPDATEEELGGAVVELAQALRERIGISFDVELVQPGTLARSEYKARRWIDERVHV
jgi:phenylacetate-coenzyme A ligase PaaK-like adenylate-forming protein